jgi:hypothetical protein
VIEKSTPLISSVSSSFQIITESELMNEVVEEISKRSKIPAWGLLFFIFANGVENSEVRKVKD